MQRRRLRPSTDRSTFWKINFIVNRLFTCPEACQLTVRIRAERWRQLRWLAASATVRMFVPERLHGLCWSEWQLLVARRQLKAIRNVKTRFSMTRSFSSYHLPAIARKLVEGRKMKAEIRNLYSSCLASSVAITTQTTRFTYHLALLQSFYSEL